MEKYRVSVIGATGMVGQRFILLLEDHPWFQVTALYASGKSAGKTYEEAVRDRWAFDKEIPGYVRNMVIRDSADLSGIEDLADFTFCAVNLPKDQIIALEEACARREVPVVSNNSAFRLWDDVPMMIPEINAGHMAAIEHQRKRLGTKIGFVACKPNCSIQGYVPALTPLRRFGIDRIMVCTYQAISGAGKTFKTWPEMKDNVIPFINGEEQKSEIEPLKIWGTIENGVIVPDKKTVISAQCLRVAASDGHMAAVTVKFDNKPSIEEIRALWDEYEGLPQKYSLPSAPKKFLTYFEDNDRPQTRLDRDIYGGMGISIGRLREDCIFDYKFVSLSHNMLRGAAGGAVETAELLCHEGYIVKK